MLFFALLILMQEPAAIKVDVRLVNAAFTVRDANGKLVNGLTKDDFDLLEDGVPQEIKFFSRSSDLPLRLGLLLDGSGSQRSFNKAHHKDLEKFVEATLDTRDRALLLGFGNRLRVAADFTGSASAVIKGLTHFEKGRFHGMEQLDRDGKRSGGTAVFDAVAAVSRQKLKQFAGERKAIVLLSDGEDNASVHSLSDAIEAAQGADAPIYTVRYTEIRHGVASRRNREGADAMDRLAEETGGIAFDATTGNVEKHLARIGEELRNLYDIGYKSSNSGGEGQFRKITIRAKKAGLKVRAKGGYFAP